MSDYWAVGTLILHTHTHQCVCSNREILGFYAEIQIILGQGVLGDIFSCADDTELDFITDWSLPEMAELADVISGAGLPAYLHSLNHLLDRQV